jgi:hypothetical protein
MISSQSGAVLTTVQLNLRCNTAKAAKTKSFHVQMWNSGRVSYVGIVPKSTNHAMSIVPSVLEHRYHALQICT